MMSTSHPTSDTPDAALARVVHFFEHLQPHDLAHLDQLYTQDAQFKDPFNDVQGIPAIAHIFAHMFERLDAPRFVITQQVTQGTQCFVTWDFEFVMPQLEGGKPQTIHGASHLVLRQTSGMWRIAVHRDYWDAAEELYEKLPLIGHVMRWLKQRMRS